MNLEERIEARKSTEARRRPPGGMRVIRIDEQLQGRLPVELADTKNSGHGGPLEFHVTATDANGEPGAWLEEDWWADLIALTPEDHVTVRFTASPRVLTNPLILQHVRMLRRVVPSWRLVGHGRIEDFRTDENVRAVACSSYHEVRIEDRGTGPDGLADDSGRRSCERLFADIRAVQLERNLSTPILVRIARIKVEDVDAPTAGRLCAADALIPPLPTQ